MSERGMWGAQRDTRRISRTSGAASFVRRRIMDPNPIDIGGKLVRRWSGWYYVEMFDNSNGNPMGMYLSPPSYEDFAGLYQSSTVKDLAGVLTDSREVGDDIQMDVNQTFFSLRG